MLTLVAKQGLVVANGSGKSGWVRFGSGHLVAPDLNMTRLFNGLQHWYQLLWKAHNKRRQRDGSTAEAWKQIYH